MKYRNCSGLAWCVCMILIYVISSDQLELFDESCSSKVFGSGFSLESEAG